MTATDTAAAHRPRRLGRLMHAILSLLIGGLLCLTPVTSIIALGWLTRRMEYVTARRWSRDGPAPGWILGARGSGRFTRVLGGLAANIRVGFLSLAGLAAWSLPFTALWLGSWWAGWENSFNKGYEQAWVGPSAGLFAVAVALPLLALSPFALAHFAAEQRFGAFFELRRIRQAFGHAGLRALWLAIVSVMLAVPLFGARALPVFVEDIVPGFDRMTPDDVGAIVTLAALATAGYAFVALVILRSLAASAYAIGAARAAHGPQAAVWAGSAAAQVPGPARGPRALTRWSVSVLAPAVWFGLVVLIYVGQFMNHSWPLWLTHPVFLLPWPG